MNPTVLLSLLLLFPLAGALLNGFSFGRFPRWLVHVIALGAIGVPFCAALMTWFELWKSQGVIPLESTLFEWLYLPLIDAAQKEFSIPFVLRFDPLSGLLSLIITGVGFLIHLYSTVYMSEEKVVHRFFSYLNLFVFAMLCLVLGGNMVVTFLGWEGVGLCSYLLIGYWFEERANALAGMKAFIVNRIGDMGFILGMILCYVTWGTLDYVQLRQAIEALPLDWFIQNASLVMAVGISFLVAVTGKSAQIPLFVWLPDAMAGPTPVSALIHAATMVTAGVYLMVRLSPLLVMSPEVMHTIACVGGLTAIFAATIGLVQNDIKKVLAYSTVSQLGFMVLACGVGAFSFGVAHLITHAFFKALLFLGAGSVIYAMHHEQDIRKMGGLIRVMPVTGVTFLMGTAAIMGVPGFAGFFSKDEILYAAWTGPYGSPWFWAMGALAAACTSFYMVRLVVLVFLGAPRWSHAPSENPWPMTLPLVVLSIFAVISGYIAVPHALSNLFTSEAVDASGHPTISGAAAHGNVIGQWLHPVLGSLRFPSTLGGPEHFHSGSLALEWGLMGTSTAIMLVVLLGAWLLYRQGPQGGHTLAQRFPALYALLLDKWRVDELYKKVCVSPLKRLGEYCYVVGDRFIIEGLVNDVPRTIKLLATLASDSQSGLVRSYLKLFFVGMVLLIFFILNVVLA